VLSAFITLLLSVHLLAVNIATGGPILGAWLDWRGTRGDDLAARAAARLAKASLHAFTAGALLGLLIGWLKWDAAYGTLWNGPLSYKLRWAIIEVAFSVVLMLVWWRWLPGQAGGSQTAMIGRGFLAVLASTNLLYHIPALFAVASRLHGAANPPDQVLKGAAFRALMLAAETPALAVHVSLASVAVAGLVVLRFAMRSPKSELPPENVRLARQAGWAMLWPSVLQLPVGLWTLMSLSPAAQNQIMGQSALGTLLLVGSLAAALWLINDLVQLTFGEPTKSLARRATVAMLLTVVLMTAMQQQTRWPIRSSTAQVNREP
jgi:hypothetical protein